jgi:hypothetical protein
MLKLTVAVRFRVVEALAHVDGLVLALGDHAKDVGDGESGALVQVVGEEDPLAPSSGKRPEGPADNVGDLAARLDVSVVGGVPVQGVDVPANRDVAHALDNAVNAGVDLTVGKHNVWKKVRRRTGKFRACKKVRVEKLRPTLGHAVGELLDLLALVGELGNKVRVGEVHGVDRSGEPWIELELAGCRIEATVRKTHSVR